MSCRGQAYCQHHGLLVKRALDGAVAWHEGQYRKYPEVRVPYASHVAGVVAIVARHGFGCEVQAAAALHDAIEDCDVTFEQLSTAFGKPVATLVWHCSEQDKSLPWEERKRLYVEAFVDKPWPAQAISLADKIDNFQSTLVCAANYGDPWKMFKRGRNAQICRFKALEGKLAGLAPHPLIDEYRATLAMLLDLEVAG